MKPTRFLAVFSLWAGFLGGVQNVSAQPNMVVIMTDDLSLDAFNSLVDGGWLPNIRTYLIDGGIRFSNSFVTDALCCPSRATFLTGQYPHNHGVLSNQSPDPFRPGITWPGWFPSTGDEGVEAKGLPVWLRAAGYHTANIGKYLNGYGVEAPDGVADAKTYIPPGWDNWQGLIDPGTYRVYDYELNDNGTIVAYGNSETDYQTDVLARRSVEYLQSRKDNPQPFFLNITPLAPHIEVLDVLELFLEVDPLAAFEAGIRPAPRHAHLTDGDAANGELPALVKKPSFNESDISDKPACPQPPPLPEIEYNPVPFCVGDRPLLDDVAISNVEKQYVEMLASMLAVDDMVGDIFDALDANGKIQDTVVIFTSDNGWFYGEHRLSGKEMPYDEGIRVPLLIRSPTAPAGVTADQIVLNNDLAPTLAELAQAVPLLTVDGASLQPLLQDPESEWFRKRFLVEHWHIPSLLKFQLATSFSLRWKFNNLDFMYSALHADHTDPAAVTHKEFYEYNTDPYAENSLTLAASLTNTLQQLVSNLRVCKGQFCRFLEGL